VERTAHTVHFQIYFNFKTCSTYKGFNIVKLKMCKKATFEHIFSYEYNKFSHLFLVILVCFDIKINNWKKLFLIFLIVHFSQFLGSFCYKICNISVQNQDISKFQVLRAPKIRSWSLEVYF
jgi:hypothetical protein